MHYRVRIRISLVVSATSATGHNLSFSRMFVVVVCVHRQQQKPRTIPNTSQVVGKVNSNQTSYVKKQLATVTKSITTHSMCVRLVCIIQIAAHFVRLGLFVG